MLNDLYLPDVSGTGMRYFVLDMPLGGGLAYERAGDAHCLT